MIFYVRGGGEIVRYFGVGEGEGDGDRGILFSSGSVAGEGIWGEDKVDDGDEGKLCFTRTDVAVSGCLRGRSFRNVCKIAYNIPFTHVSDKTCYRIRKCIAELVIVIFSCSI